MQNLVVPTDFSPAADNAMLFAGKLATSMQATVCLLHVYQIPVSMNDVPVMIIPVEELQEIADKGLEKSKELLQKHYPSLSIKTESRLGDINDELKTVCKESDPYAIIIGKHSSSGLERVLFGNTTLSIIKHSKTSVIVIPDTAKNYNIKNIGLAVDTSGSSIPQDKIKQLSSTLNAALHIVHVETDKNSNQDFHSPIPDIGSTTIIRDDNFVHGIESFVNEKQIDLIIILPHKHSLVEKIFFKTHTKELMEEITIPVMTIPDES
jgi:nucleotide-binding universal stress UspA family protein